MQPQRGEIIRINLNPTQGREQTGEARPCLVLSHTRFNQTRGGIVIVSPITHTLKPEIKTLIPIPEGFKISGSVITEQIRTLDLNQSLKTLFKTSLSSPKSDRPYSPKD